MDWHVRPCSSEYLISSGHDWSHVLWVAIGQLGGSVPRGWAAVGWAVGVTGPLSSLPQQVLLDLLIHISRLPKPQKQRLHPRPRLGFRTHTTPHPPYSVGQTQTRGPFQSKRWETDASSSWERLESIVAIFSIYHRGF